MAKAENEVSTEGACKRFKINRFRKSKEKIKAYKSHILTKKEPEEKERPQKGTTLTSADLKRIKAVLSK